MITLNNLEKLCKKRKVRGRGGDHGGTSGRGHAGQGSRSGGATRRPSFEGGQMPLVRRLPKRGFNNTVFQTIYEIVNLGRLNDVFEDGAHVDRQVLIERGLIRGTRKSLVKVLGDGELTKKLIVHVDACSQKAQEIIKQCGGEVHLNTEM